MESKTKKKIRKNIEEGSAFTALVEKSTDKYTSSTLIVPIYNFQIDVVLSETEDFLDGVNTYMKDIGSNLNLPGDMIYEGIQVSGEGKNIVFLKDNAKIGVIMHETIHLLSALMSTKGIAYDVMNDEPIAYLFGTLSELVLKCHEANKNNYAKKQAGGQGEKQKTPLQ